MIRHEATFDQRPSGTEANLVGIGELGVGGDLVAVDQGAVSAAKVTHNPMVAVFEDRCVTHRYLDVVVGIERYI